MAGQTVRILDGNTFVVCDERGDVEASPTEPTGLFSSDTRFLSSWVLTINGNKLNSLSVDDIQYFESRFFLVPGTGTVYIDAKLSVIRERAVGDGFHEELTILNHENEPVDLEVRVDAASDFADLFEVKDALKKLGTYDARVEDGKLRLGYERESFRRETVISASEPASVDERGLTFRIRIEPHSDWTTDLDVVTSYVAAGETFTRPKYGRGRKKARPNMERSLEKWIDDAPRLECDQASLEATYRRSLVDLAASAFLAAGRRRQEPACSWPAVVHDDVRPRQHLHQPADAAVHARIGRRDPAGRWATGRAAAATTSATRTQAGSSTRCATGRWRRSRNGPTRRITAQSTPHRYTSCSSTSTSAGPATGSSFATWNSRRGPP